MAAGATVAASVGWMARRFVAGGAVSLSAAVYVDIGSQYLLIYSGAH
jgi:hypothetical protein